MHWLASLHLALHVHRYITVETLAIIGEQNFVLYRGVTLSQVDLYQNSAFGAQQSGLYKEASSRQG